MATSINVSRASPRLFRPVAPTKIKNASKQNAHAGGGWWTNGAEPKGLSVRGCVIAGVNKAINGVASVSETEIKNRDEGEDEAALQNFKIGSFVEKRQVYRQTFVIRSYEIGPDKTATMETLMNLLQL